MHKLKYLILFICLPAFAQEINQRDSEGNRHGKWKVNFEDSNQIKFEGNFEHGQETGNFKFYKKGFDKHPSAILNFSSENDSVFVTYYTQEGNPVSEGVMLNKKREGRWIYYHENSSEIMMLEEYKNDLLEGEQITYYPDGAPAETSMYKNGKKDGESFIYAESGQVLQQLNYKEGELEGPAVYYNKNGDKLRSGKYKNGKKTGTWKFYENGKIVKEEKF